MNGGRDQDSESLMATKPDPLEETKEKLVLFGFVDLTDWSENWQAGVLAGGALVSSLGFAYLQEKFVYSVEMREGTNVQLLEYS